MTLIALNSLSLTRSAALFDDLTFSLERGNRLGLVAANGAGKSSLLACLTGDLPQTEGTLTRARGLRTALVAQEIDPVLMPLTLREAVIAGLDDPEEIWRADIALDDLAIPAALRDRPLAALSGGWQRVAVLARALAGEPDLLLLDEPTNHLDLSRILWLERLIASLPRDLGLILASHDRAFLDAVCTHTLFLRPAGSRLFALPYSRARAALDETDAAQERQFRNEMKAAAQLRRQAAKLKNIGINSGSDLLTVKTRQLTERAERIEEAARPAHRERGAGDIRLDGAAAQARALVQFDEGPIMAPDGTPLFRMPRAWIVPGDRVVLLGANGAGKSRLVAAVAAAAAGAGTGPVRVAPAARLGHADQSLRVLAAHRDALGAVTGTSDVGDARARALLAGAGIGVDLQTRPLSALSGGQRSRLVLLLLRLARPTLYLLDEPTNHLDIDGQEALERELSEDAAAALIVSHDRAFVRAVGTRFWLIERGRLTEVDGPDPWFARAAAQPIA